MNFRPRRARRAYARTRAPDYPQFGRPEPRGSATPPHGNGSWCPAARAMVAQSEQAFLAIAQGNVHKETTVKILEYKEMEPFFVKGESNEP
jgi:hypothetical protein